MNLTKAELSAALDRAKARCVETIMTSGPLDPVELVIRYFNEEISKATKRAAPGAANTENGKVLGHEIMISIDHMEITVKGVL